MKMRDMTLAQISSAVSGQFVGETEAMSRKVESVVMDSRAVTSGSLFVAIEGERSDGHDYIESSLKNGAVCCISEKVIDIPDGHYILVESTLQAIKDLAEFYRGLFPEVRFIGITGSVGKTTTKEMISAVLAEKYCVHKTSGNYNNEIGVPMTIFGLREGHEVSVVEMGISDFGEMGRLTKIVRPDVVVMSNIGDSHLEFLGNREGVLRAKGEIFQCANPDGVAIVNGDDKLLVDMSPGDFAPEAANMDKICYGLGEDNDIKGKSIVNLGPRGMEFDIDLQGRIIQAEVPAYGNHMVLAALAAAAVGSRLGLTPEEIRRGIGHFENVGKRADIIETGFLTLIDDCYNANPNSVKVALDSLAGLDGRRVAILGDMGELGDNSAALHTETGKYAVTRTDCLIAVGDKAKEIYSGAKKTSESVEVWYFPNKEELFSVLYTLVRKGDTVLVKASRSMKFEDIVSELKGYV